MDSSNDDSDAGPPPRVLRAALGIWCALGAFLLLRAALAWSGQAMLRRMLVERQSLPTEQAGSAATTLLLVNTGIAVVLAVGYGVLAWLMLQRKSWARLAVTALAIAHLALVLVMASVTAQHVIVLLLAVAGWACSWRGSSSRWLAGEHH
ncbi:protein-S-isoprenylcysteine O-methyltransferase Ste14 [Saccharopolyspora lacisalsi]|uniref:Protein-S-isoprenylcysteine O-methyltransferase Ste14 n=1 Tax=Halosaccharopolyspora lacisalsi TaxID=1000566 RepID=A0A839E5L8_9PSEU|nr:hypothetical protein [Halosaccharopolyspora lacisalsi]MBA8827155.1 protein-S-isoprenylcysteine O-methyltransferase Ste14 [Halosaccharopolyspora lacisalsi]